MTDTENRHSLVIYFDDLADQIQKLYALAKRDADAESIHDLRVAIKRMRAFMGILQHVSFHSFYNALKALELEQRRTFLNGAMISFQSLESIRAQCSELTQEQSDDWLIFKIRQRFRNIMDDMTFRRTPPTLAEPDYHQLRISSKEGRYTLEVLQAVSNDASCIPLNEKLQVLHHALGEWHDFDMSRQFVTRLATNDPHAFSYIHYIVRKQKECLRRFSQSWKDFFSGS